ncbi:MAG: citrate/2-methylcitrate synthase [Treponema sp.]|jgi:citrate synthase|nr:citrate/2-methylcitrate synthase [Treponema sp.]
MATVKDYIPRITGNDYIDEELYTTYNVKRGLRNEDGTGVLVGLTRVGYVHAYIIDEGEKIPVDGKLYYRGIDIEDIVHATEQEKRYAFEETVYLLMFGQLPTAEQLENFCALMGESRTLPQHFAEDSIMKAPSNDLMNKLASSVLALYSYDPDSENRAPENILRQCIEIISRLPTIAAYAYTAKKHYYDHESLIIHLPESSHNVAEAFLALIRPDQKFSRLEAETLDLALVLHAEHGGGNNSTFAVHLVSSADTDSYSAIAAGIASLKGYKHGGASVKVMAMMDDIKQHVEYWDSEEEVSEYLRKILRGEAYDGTGLIYGQGHAVYTKSDPRAILLRNKAAELVKEKPELQDEFKLYVLIEKLSPLIVKEIKGATKTICTNVDFYSGFVYKMLKIPQELYTSIFAISRVTGWCAHRMEEVITGGRIIRPAYKCVQKKTSYVALANR